MIHIFYSTLIILFFLFTGNQYSPEELLSGTGQKTWYLTAMSPDKSGACSISSVHCQDNSWTFYSDGSFEYDHGALTIDPECEGEGCCSDMVNLVGKWELTNNKVGLKLTTLHEKGKPENIFSVVLFDAVFKQMEGNQFVLTQSDPKSAQSYTFSFQAK